MNLPGMDHGSFMDRIFPGPSPVHESALPEIPKSHKFDIVFQLTILKPQSIHRKR